ncbi:MAG TPA: outer membrane protein assembly factor BamE [Burkholderiales bacterium]|nr:outer membrane protein assembly factor BamE [Burkholderiales bacterium]
MKGSMMVLTLALAACTSFPSKDRLVTDREIARLHPGASRDEVLDLLGAPRRVESPPRLEREVWTYKTLNAEIWRTQLAVQFSRDGVVREILLIDDPVISRG